MGHLADPVGLVARVDAVDLVRDLYLLVPAESCRLKQVWVEHAE